MPTGRGTSVRRQQQFNLRLPPLPQPSLRGRTSQLSPRNYDVELGDTMDHRARALGTSSPGGHGGAPASPSGTPVTMATTVTTAAVATAGPSRQSDAAGYPPPPPSAASRSRKPMTEAQRQLLAFQREFVRNTSRMTLAAPVGAASPGSPRLIPLGSPGPVTPLQLEDDAPGGDYLSARGGSHTEGSTTGMMPGSGVTDT